MAQMQTYAPAAFGRKPLSPRRSLDPIFSPKNIAVSGATETPNSVGRTVLWNLIAQSPDQTVLMVSMHDESLDAERALRAGISRKHKPAAAPLH